MKLQSLAFLGLFFLALSQRMTAADAQTNKTGVEVADSDGDGIPDASDPHPFIADIQRVSWNIGPLSLGWRFDGSIDSVLSSLNEHEKKLLKQTEISFGGRLDAGSEVTAGARGRLSANPFELFGLKGSSAEAGFQSRFAASGNLTWSKSDQNTAHELRRLVGQDQIAQRLSGQNLEFTVSFYNHGDTDFVGENLQVPIKVGDSVATIAQPFGANGPEPRIRIPAHRNRPTPVRFRANLDTTQSLRLLTEMETHPPTISIEETQGAITATINGEVVDAISQLTQIQSKTCKLTTEVGGSEFTWMIARRDERTGKPLHLTDAFNAVNAMASAKGGADARIFKHTDKYLRSALGLNCSLTSERWWVMTQGNSPIVEFDVDPSIELSESIRLRYRIGFPAEMKRWIENPPYTDTWALNVAATVFFRGRGGVAKNLVKAVELSQRAADLGDAEAIGRLGIAYSNGEGGLAKDEKKAVELLQKAADLGCAACIYNLGLAYDSGLGGLAKDEKKAVELWQKAADLGDAVAIGRMGLAYYYGEGGLTKNEKKGIALSQKAADLGDLTAAHFLKAMLGRSTSENK